MESAPTLRVISIVPGTSVDGPGLRTSIYFAGCKHNCPGCHNPESWSFNAGFDMTIPEILDVIEENGFNVTFSGGDPIYQAENLSLLASELKNRGYNLWCFTGFMWEDLLKNTNAINLIKFIDVIVDGPFIQSKRDTSLIFRGSSNQRLIDVKQTFETNTVKIWQDPLFNTI